METVAAGHFEIFGHDTGTLRSAVVDLHQHLHTHDPAVLVQHTDPSVHGSITGVLGQIHDVPTVDRYAGDRIVEYRISSAGSDSPRSVLELRWVGSRSDWRPNTC